MAVKYLDAYGVDGCCMGRASTEKIGFYGTTPCDQAAHITSVSTAAATTTTPYGYAASTQADAIVTAINAILVVLEEVGLTASA
jgi:hypothetical protein